ncbi:probable glucan 1,3-beta-glucosidase A isoform X1 [Syzygium oleosum]|uniref:probable glucan 1,3-beta-glucosidase A isoform X1 n=1 Tax=Syzygium oleosum TaxID=219896 RepID=UPI0011D1D0E7|nr:probable glucan 1,3-beta-glucosidase A isoform X1 [Syzygium oleosum]XP_056172828.1 probable glucan 1,3-beta-glucosidase A isoform X1 [Syzygium oleosum]
MEVISNGVRSIGNHSDQEMENRNPKVRAVNLGGWLVTEGWIKPSLFDAIPNKDFLDGTRLQFKSITVGKFLCAESGGGSRVVANSTGTSEVAKPPAGSSSRWETFRLWRIDETLFNFRVANKQFVGLNSGGDGVDLVATCHSPGAPETFEIVRNPDDVSRVRIKASNGLFLQVRTEKRVTADYQCNESNAWRDKDPSVFVMSFTKRLEGEFQVTNGLGPHKAPKVMREHWSTFIVEDDFKFVAENGLDAVRIPVGWWIASDPNPPPPYVGGSLAFLDSAFSWAEKYGLKVIIDLHAAPGSQNGWEHSSSRDGFREWGDTDDTIQQTLHVIEFLTSRYTKSPSLYAVDLLNEPLAEILPLETVTKYYRAGHNAVRKHSPTAYVIMSRVLGASGPELLLPVASGLDRTVVDTHNYVLFRTKFDTIQDNLDFIYKDKRAQLDRLATPDGPLTFVGEWAVEWTVNGATKEEYQKFAEAQQEVFGRATFGWAYWTLKCAKHHWSLEWMIKNGYIKL